MKTSGDWDKRLDAAGNARRRLPTLVSEYFEHGREIVAAGENDPAALHRLRLATKRLRYTLELFRPCYGPGMARCLAGLRVLQQLLGDINDVAASTRILESSLHKDSPQRLRLEKFLQELHDTRVAAFRKYWHELFDAPNQEAWWTQYLARHARRPNPKQERNERV
jgi:CHAD domain-containing protein